MSTPPLDYTPRMAAPQPEQAERPRIRCPHCRAIDPEIDYGELTYYEQPYDPSTEDWTGAGEVVGDTDGSATIIAKCSVCDNDITTYLIGWSNRHPNHAPHAHFVHEVHIPRGLPLKRTLSQNRHPELSLRDADLQQLIDGAIRTLSSCLDEKEERIRLGLWKEAARG